MLLKATTFAVGASLVVAIVPVSAPISVGAVASVAVTLYYQPVHY